MDLPFSSHPLYHVRRANIFAALWGLAFAVLSLAPWDSEPFYFETFVLLTSLTFVAADLCYYAERKKREPDQDPPWPLRKFMLGDAILAVVLFLTFIATVSTAANSYGMNRAGRVVGSYAALGALVCSVLHAYSFGKELEARYKVRWLAGIRILPQPCARCGYTETPDPVCTCPVHYPCQSASTNIPPNVFSYAGSSAPAAYRHFPSTTERTNVMTPDSSSRDSDMEEGLLIGSDFGTGYGSIADPEPTLDQPEEVVVGAKGKKRATGKKQHRSGGTNAEKPRPAESGHHSVLFKSDK